jgi:hypothetical protein
MRACQLVVARAGTHHPSGVSSRHSAAVKLSVRPFLSRRRKSVPKNRVPVIVVVMTRGADPQGAHVPLPRR